MENIDFNNYIINRHYVNKKFDFSLSLLYTTFNCIHYKVGVKMQKDKVIKKAYKIMNNVTPLKTDCGKLCDCECCKGDENTGMLVFPGEEDFLEQDKTFSFKKTTDGKTVVVCASKCDRKVRPLSCRIFPLFPMIIDSKIYLFDDPRAKGICPLLYDEIEIDARFEKSVLRVGKLLCKNDETKEFLQKITDEICTILEMQQKIFSNKGE